MWSLTSLRVKRIGGFRKFRLLPPKDFFDSIDPNATSSALSTALSQQPSLVGQNHGPDHPIIGRLRLAASSQL